MLGVGWLTSEWTFGSEAQETMGYSPKQNQWKYIYIYTWNSKQPFINRCLVQPTRKTRCFQRCSIFFILNLGAPWLDFHIFFFRWGWWTNHQVVIYWIYPPPRMPVANGGLGWDSLLKMVHNPGGDCYWVGGRPNIYIYLELQTTIYKWPYNWVTGVITLLIGVITPLITGRGPPCIYIYPLVN